MVDESHMLVLYGASLKPSEISRVLNGYGEYASATFVSATPTQYKYLPEQLKHLRQIRVHWEDVRSVPIKHARVSSRTVMSRVLGVAIDSLSTEEHPYFFYNNLNGIVNVVKQLRKVAKLGPDDIRIICADTEDNKEYLKRHLGRAFVPEGPVYLDDNQKPVRETEKKIHLVTSYGFFGSDFYDKKASIWVVSDLAGKGTHYDISTALPQIVGRFRDRKDATINFLWTTRDDRFDLTEEEFDAQVRDELQEAEWQVELARKSPRQRKTLKAGIHKDPYLMLADDKQTVLVNPLAWNGQMQMYNAFHHDYKTIHNGGDNGAVATKLKDAFGEVDTIEVRDLTPQEKVLLKKVPDFRKMCRAYVFAKNVSRLLATPEEWADAEHTIGLVESGDRLRLIADAYELLGGEKLLALDCRKGAIEQEYSIRKALTSDRDVIDKHLRLRVGHFYTNKDLRARIQSLYDSLGLSKKAKATDAREWYDIQRSTPQGESGYRILRVK
jgi:hypothetical protein